MDITELEGVLNAHAYLRVERPPMLWAPDVELEAFIRLLGEMISAALTRNDHSLGGITLNISNVTVERDDAPRPLPHGDFVAVTVRSKGDWSPETTWQPTAPPTTPFVSRDLQRAAAGAEAAFGYSRTLADNQGSVTVFIRRASPDR